MSEGVNGIFLVPQTHSEPSARCLVCASLKYEKAEYVDLMRPYLCDRCRSALLKIVESEDSTDGNRTDR